MHIAYTFLQLSETIIWLLASRPPTIINANVHLFHRLHQLEAEPN